ncbi:MAG: hypothetical protein NTZ48_06160 [Candidatus Omnitrophica bacterium]|nr:hypothetical protein [Candidatus Omnitrophota bacterium]
MFEKFNFSPKQVNKYFKVAVRNYKIASVSVIPEVIFMFSYQALIKLAITVCAKNNLRVKARAGHHIELLNKLAQFINDKSVDSIGNKMRRKRNLDLYGDGIIMSEREAIEYRDWLKNIFVKTEVYLNVNLKLF